MAVDFGAQYRKRYQQILPDANMVEALKLAPSQSLSGNLERILGSSS